MRLFISITPPPDIVQELINLQQQIQQAQLFDAKYVKSENFHVTLLFLGTVTDTEFNNIQQIFTTVQHNQFSITLSHVELHQNHDSTNLVLWVILDSPELVELANKLAHMFDHISDYTSSPFIGHITIARIKKLRVSYSQAQETITQLSLTPLSWLVTSIELQQSTLTDQAPIYTIHARNALK